MPEAILRDAQSGKDLPNLFLSEALPINRS